MVFWPEGWDVLEEEGGGRGREGEEMVSCIFFLFFLPSKGFRCLEVRD